MAATTLTAATATTSYHRIQQQQYPTKSFLSTPTPPLPLEPQDTEPDVQVGYDHDSQPSPSELRRMGIKVKDYGYDKIPPVKPYMRPTLVDIPAASTSTATGNRTLKRDPAMTHRRGHEAAFGVEEDREGAEKKRRKKQEEYPVWHPAHRQYPSGTPPPSTPNSRRDYISVPTPLVTPNGSMEEIGTPPPDSQMTDDAEDSPMRAEGEEDELPDMSQHSSRSPTPTPPPPTVMREASPRYKLRPRPAPPSPAPASPKRGRRKSVSAKPVSTRAKPTSAAKPKSTSRRR